MGEQDNIDKKSFIRNLHEFVDPGEKIAARERIVEISPLEQIFPMSESEVTALGITPEQEQNALLQENRFQESTVVVIDCNIKGLGDSIIEARHAVATAERTPHKEFLIRMPQSVTDMKSLYLPNNARFVNNISENYLRRDDTFFLNFSSVSPKFVAQAINRWGLSGRFKNRAQEIEEDGRVSNWYNSALPYPKNVYEALGFDVHDSNYNLLDIYYAARAGELGVAIRKSDLEKSFLHFPQDRLRKLPQNIDILIAPDAKELDENKRQSRKSLSVEKWAEVFRQLPQSLEIGIVKGLSHPKYTQKVLEVAQFEGLNAFEVDTPTLNDFADAVLQSKKFVGGDSGTTHVASEIVLAARENGRLVDIRELFTYDLIDIGEYAIRGLGRQGRILEIFKRNRTPIRDHKLIPSKAIADFIAG